MFGFTVFHGLTNLMVTNDGGFCVVQPRIFILLRRCLFDSDDEVISFAILALSFDV